MPRQAMRQQNVEMATHSVQMGKTVSSSQHAEAISHPVHDLDVWCFSSSLLYASMAWRIFGGDPDSRLTWSDIDWLNSTVHDAQGICEAQAQNSTITEGYANRRTILSNKKNLLRTQRCHSLLHAEFRKDLESGHYRHGYVSKSEKPLPHFENVCLIDALRALGAKVPYAADGRFWALEDGNRMLRPVCQLLDSVARPCFGKFGKYLVHYHDHFYALKTFDDAFSLTSKKNSVTFEDESRFNDLLSSPEITIWRLANDVVSAALQNYESFYNLLPGQGNIEDVICSCAGVEGWACANLSSCSRTHPQIDKSGGAFEPSSGAELTLNLPDEELPASIRQYAGAKFKTIITNGNGACAIHSVFGTHRPTHGDLFRPHARHFLRAKLGSTREEFRTGVSDNLLHKAVAEHLWMECIRPIARIKAKVDDQIPNVDHETRLIWKEIEARPDLCEILLERVQREHEHYAEFTRRRTAMVDAFALLCVRSLEHCFVRPLLTLVGLEDEYCNGPYEVEGEPLVQTKLDVLFLAHPRAAHLRRSVIESCGMDFLASLLEKVQDIVGNESFPSMFIEKLCAFGECIQAARNHPAAEDHAAIVFPLVFPSYVVAMTANADYYLSDLELLCLCRCCKQNVVICLHDIENSTLSYHKHAIVNDGAIVFTSIQVQPGQARVRSHFERLEVVEHTGKQCNSLPMGTGNLLDTLDVQRKGLKNNAPEAPGLDLSLDSLILGWVEGYWRRERGAREREHARGGCRALVSRRGDWMGGHSSEAPRMNMLQRFK